MAILNLFETDFFKRKKLYPSIVGTIAFVFFLIWSGICYSQDYLIDFSGLGANSIVDSVYVENLTQGKSIKLSGTETLHLAATVTNVYQVLDFENYPIRIFPNPSNGDCTIEFGAKYSGISFINVYDIVGKEITHTKQQISDGIHSFKISGLSSGIYTIHINIDNQIYSGKIISNGKSKSQSRIFYEGNIRPYNYDSYLKSAKSEQFWQYNEGDRLKFIGKSGKYSTVFIDIPTSSKNIQFIFIECTDTDGNDYPIVKIGNQFWMGENLKTTKYNDETNIPYIKENSDWIALTTGAYCWYNNDEDLNKNTYGALYNWYAISTNKLAPNGWHVPTDEEWKTLSSYLGGNAIAGGKLKETGQRLWITPNSDATNESGFTALPGGIRRNDFERIGYEGTWWSCTAYPYWNTAWSRSLSYSNSEIYIGNPTNREFGNSVRCMLDSLSISTKEISEVTQNSATCGGNIIFDGGLPTKQSGVCWSTYNNPSIVDNVISENNNSDNFISNISGLEASTTYFVRAFAINDIDTFYGEVKTFTTLTEMPTSIVISPIIEQILPWDEKQLQALGYDVDGNEVSLSNIEWETSDSLLISIDQNGHITGNLLGSAIISASLEGIKDSIEVSVDIDGDYYVGENVLIDSSGSWAETSVALNPKNPLNLFVSANLAGFSSSDGGRTWKTTNDNNSIDPNVCFLGNGNILWQGMMFGDPRSIRVKRSTDGGISFPEANSFMAYKPANGKGNPDQEIMCVDTSSVSQFNGSVYIISSDYPSESPEYKQTGFSMIVIVSRDGGKTWLEPVDISTCLDCGQEHSSYITTGANGEVYAAWWNGKDEVVFNKSLDGGITWGEEKVVRKYIRSNEYTLTDDVRGNITIDVDRGQGKFKGRIYISGTDITPVGGGAADSWVVHSSNGGDSWSDIVLLSDGAKGAYKYYFQPRISVAPNGRIDAVWYDTRNWDGTNTNEVDYDLYYAYSTDGGQSFSANIRVTNSSSTKVTTCPSIGSCGQRVLYEYIGLASDNNRAMPVWTTIHNGNATPAFATIWTKVVANSTNTKAVISTSSVAEITQTTAISGGNVTSDGGSLVTSRGVCWSVSQNPTISNNKTSDGSGTGTYTSTITGLAANTTYYVRAYAINSEGTSYGNEISFTTSKNITAPTITTVSITNISQSSAASGGNVTSDGGAEVTVRGVCWSINQNPTITDSKTTDGSGTGSFTSDLTGLTASTTYYGRAYATNSIGTAYGNQVTFRTLESETIPTVFTSDAIVIDEFTARLGGDVTNDGGSAVILTGVSINTSPGQTTNKYDIGSGLGEFWANFEGFDSQSTYYVKAYAVNSSGVAYGNEISFTTEQVASLPTLTTASVTNITQTTATCGGNVSSNGGATITAKGVCWSISPNPTTLDTKTSDGDGTGSFISNITELSENTTYYVRAYATNNAGTAYGNQISFVTDGQGALPLVITSSATNITVDGATIGGNVISDGGFDIIECGVWLSLNPDFVPRYGYIVASELGEYSYYVSELTSNTKYYVKAYATNSNGTTFGETLTFNTSDPQFLPIVATTSPSEVTWNSAMLGGSVTESNGGSITEYGICINTEPNITIENKFPLGSGSGTFIENFTGLSASTVYYVRAYAINDYGIAYGNQITFSTNQAPTLPSLTTTDASYNPNGVGTYNNIVTTGGNVTSDGWDTVTERGVVWIVYGGTDEDEMPTLDNYDGRTSDGAGLGSFTSTISGVPANTLYYVRAYATNGVGTAYGNRISIYIRFLQ